MSDMSLRAIHALFCCFEGGRGPCDSNTLASIVSFQLLFLAAEPRVKRAEAFGYEVAEDLEIPDVLRFFCHEICCS